MKTKRGKYRRGQLARRKRARRQLESWAKGHWARLEQAWFTAHGVVMVKPRAAMSQPGFYGPVAAVSLLPEWPAARPLPPDPRDGPGFYWDKPPPNHG